MFTKRHILECLLLVVDQNWKLLKCPSTVKMINKMLTIHIMESFDNENEEFTKAYNMDKIYKLVFGSCVCLC